MVDTFRRGVAHDVSRRFICAPRLSLRADYSLPIRTVRTDTHVVEDTGRKGSRKPTAASGFQMPFQNFTVSLIPGSPASHDTDLACQHGAARHDVCTTDACRIVQTRIVVTAVFSSATRSLASVFIDSFVPSESRPLGRSSRRLVLAQPPRVNAQRTFVDAVVFRVEARNVNGQPAMQ